MDPLGLFGLARPAHSVCLVGTHVGVGHAVEGSSPGAPLFSTSLQRMLTGYGWPSALPGCAQSILQQSSAEAASLQAHMHSEGCVRIQHIHSGVHVPRMQVALL